MNTSENICNEGRWFLAAKTDTLFLFIRKIIKKQHLYE